MRSTPSRASHTIGWFFIVSLLYPFFSGAVSSQSETSKLQVLSNISHEQGFPKIEYFDTTSLGFHQQNYAIRRGSDNRIYALNRTNIIVYDGIGWDNITPYGTQFNRAFSLDKDNNVYTVTQNDIGYYQGNQDGQWHFTSLSSNKKLPDFGSLTDIIVFQQQVIYLTGRHLFYYHPQYGLRWLEVKDQKFAGLAKIKNKIYVQTTDHQLYQYSLENNQLNLTELDPKRPKLALKFVELNAHGQEVIASDDGVYLYEYDKQRLVKIDQGLSAWFKNNQVRAMSILSDGRIVLGSKKKGIAILDSRGHLLHFLSKNNGLKENWVSGIVEDHNKDLWLSHGSKGISRIELDHISYYQDVLGAENLEAIARYKDSLFIGSFTQGLSFLRTSSKAFEPSRFETLGDYSSVWSLMAHNDGLFVGHTNGMGLVTEDKSGTFISSTLIDSPTVYDVFRSKSQTNVIYGASGKGLLKIQKINGIWQSQGMLNNFSLALVTMTEDRFGKLWLTSHSGVIVRVDDLEQWPNSRFKRYRTPELSSKDNTLMELNGDIYIANRNGYFIADKQGVIFAAETNSQWPSEPEGSFHRHFKVASDKAIATNGSRFFNLSKNADGLVTFNEHYLERIRTHRISALLTDRFGIFWAGGSHGLVRVEPSYQAHYKVNKKPQVHKVTSLQTEKIYFGSANYGNQPLPIQLYPREQDLSFQFGTADFREADKYQYRYRLKGLINEWSKWSSEKRADFTNIPYGQFDFELQSKNDLDIQSKTTHFLFDRAPFWYQTGWFYFLLFLVGVLTMWGIAISWTKRRTQQLLKRAELLEQTVVERTHTIAMQSKELERLNKSRTRFFTHVSHELRTPLTLTIGPLREILGGQYGKVTSSVKQAMKLVLRSASSMQALLNQVLELSRLESGALSLKLETLNLAGEIQICCAPFKLLAAKQIITFETFFPSENINIEFDPKGLQSIVNNLLSNAFKFTPEKGFIHLKLEYSDKTFIIHIDDSGCGIANTELPFIFDQYYQAESIDIKPHSGTGIGLSMVREYVELHGGEIQVSSELGKGTQFIVQLPLLVSHSEPRQSHFIDNTNSIDSAHPIDSTSPIETQTIFNQPNVKGDDCPTVLIVEDNEELRLFVAHRLGERYRVLEAENGQTGLELAKQQLPDVIITDIMMPVMDGHALCQSIKSSKETDYIPLIMLTSKGTGEEIVEGINLGADDYLAKPFLMPELLARINRLIESRLTLRARYTAGELNIVNAVEAETLPSDKLNVSRITPKQDVFLQRVRTAVLKQDCQSFGVKELADALSMDRTTLYRKLKNATGETVTESIRNIRLKEAASLFNAQQGSVTEVAYGVGFKSLGHFSRSFTDHFGVSPTIYKSQNIL